MRWSSIINFFLLTVIGGLVQLWVVCILIFMKKQNINFADVLSDGSLFFFATSLSYSSLFSLLNEDHKSVGSSVVVTILCVGIVTLLSLVAYSSAAYENIRTHTVHPVSAESSSTALDPTYYMIAQIVCTFIALIYTVFVCTVTNMFSIRRPRPPETKEVTQHV
jgi:hypothetical protein